MLSIKGILDKEWTKVNVTMFPDGTSQTWKVKIPENTGTVQIKWDFENEAELIHLFQLCDLLKRDSKELYIPYLPYSRQDKTVSNESTFAKRTFISLLGNYFFEKIQSFDVHSDAFTKNRQEFISQSPDIHIQYAANHCKPDVIFYPDMGALNRYAYGHDYSYKLLPKAYGIKTRNQLTGEITDYVTMTAQKLEGKNILIVDDIIDGGRTFIEAAKKLKELGANDIYLYGSHGIFSHPDGVKFLIDNGIKHVYTTNSLIKNKSSVNLTVFEI